ncbi:MAG: hypothetical protein QGI31_06690 [Dehalococcoidia bacterium]|jgi:hypothetical protein|nr:hypothetical protein [Arenicellales bacterium]MDP7674502.1 hypothetical protein [Dehalococcoidia bacterium]|tara:strand:- start:1274 stop:1561 length:288 start_codon:yes stop_codon:yes gene_type:complete
MKRLFAIVFLCGFLIPYAYGETISYSDGSKYVGELSNGVWHGYGTYSKFDGRKFVGEYKDGVEWNGIHYSKRISKAATPSVVKEFVERSNLGITH